METHHNLDDTTISELKDLVKANADSARIFRDAAKETEKSNLMTLFTDIASNREANATELQSALSISGEPFEVETSLTQPLRSWWMKVRDTIQSDVDGPVNPPAVRLQIMLFG